MKKLHLIAIGTLIAIAFGNVLSAQDAAKPPSDSEISQKIIGNWITDGKSSTGTTLKGKDAINADGTFVSTGTIENADKTKGFEFTHEGTWKVKDGVLIEEITKTTEPEARPVGYKTHDKIVSVDDRELVYLTAKGKKITRERGK